MNYTIDTIPAELFINQFYCYNKKTLKVFIGSYVGESAKYKGTFVYNINNGLYKTRHDPEEAKMAAAFVIQNFVCSFKYEDFKQLYYIDEEEKRKKNNNTKTKYEVSKSSYYVTKTRASQMPYGHVRFDTKEEALEYTNKGLKKNKKIFEKYNIKLINLEKIIKEKIKSIKEKGLYEVAYPLKFKVTMDKMQEGDVLYRLECPYDNKDNSYQLLRIDKDYCVTVKEKVAYNVIKLSDNTLILSSEYSGHSYPAFVKMADLEDVKKAVISNNLRRIEGDIEDYRKALNEAMKFNDVYVPLEKLPQGVYNYSFGKYYQDNTDKIEELLNTETKFY